MSEKFNAAAVRLDLGFGGGHFIADNLLFVARVLNTPSEISNKNINDIENNFVDGKKTCAHQQAYVRMLTAGSLNQAKKIVEKYDILYGSILEIPVKETHRAIRNLLGSSACKSFLEDTSLGYQARYPQEILSSGR